MTSPARRASRRSQLPPSLRHAVPRRWRRGIPTAGQPLASSDHPAAVSAGFTVGASTSRLATRDGSLCGGRASPRTKYPEASGNGAGPGRKDQNAGRGSIPHSVLRDDAPRPAPHRPAGTRNIPRIRLFRWSSGMRTPALKAPDGRPSRSCRGQAAWPGTARRRRAGRWCRRSAPVSRGSRVLLIPGRRRRCRGSGRRGPGHGPGGLRGCGAGRGAG